MAHVKRNIVRPSKEEIAAISEYRPATIHEAQGRLGALDSRIKPVKHGMAFCGPAVTAKCHIGDNLMIFEAVNLCQPGDILVVSAGNNPEQGGFGDVLAAACLSRGIAGVVVDAGVRDGFNLRKMSLPVFSLGLCIKGTSKDTLGTINQPVVIGGELITPGDIIVGDDDGVVVVRKPPMELAALCAAREEMEAGLVASYNQGQFDIEDRYEMMRKKGCVWED